MWVYSVVWQVFGSGQSWPYHLVNILLHAGVGASLVVVLGPVVGRTAAVVGAVVWAVHPVHTEAVTYVSGTADPLSLLFLLWALHAGSQGRRGAAVVLFVLSVLSKESGVVFLPCLLVWDYCTGRLERRKAGWYAVVGVVTVGYLVLRHVVLAGRPGPEGVALVPRVLTGFATLPVYVRLLVFPDRLALERHLAYLTDWRDGQFLAGLVIFLVLVGVLVVFRGKRRIFFCGAWFAGNWLFHSGILFALNGNLREHWMYAASIGACAAAGLCVEWAGRWRRGRVVAWCVAGALVAGYGVRTYLRNEDWKDPVRLCRKDLEVSWSSAELRHFLATRLEQEGRYGEAIAEYRAASLLHPTDPYNYFGLARCYLATGRKEKAWQECEKALMTDPENPEIIASIAAIAEQAGDSRRAEALLAEALKRPGAGAWTHLRAGILFLNRQEFRAARDAFRTVVSLEPGNTDGWRGLGLSLWNLGSAEEAVRAMETSARLNPAQPTLLISLGRCYQALGRHHEAERWFRQALRLRPGDRDILNDMAVSLAMTGRQAEAIAIWQGIVERDPAYEPARRNLEWATHR